MALEPDFATVQEADAAFYGDSTTDDGGSGGPGDTTIAWGDLQLVARLEAGWVLQVRRGQTQNEALDSRIPGDDTKTTEQWFITRQTEGELQALDERGTARTLDPNATLGDAPHFTTESTARDAYQKWLDDHPDRGEDDDESGGDDQWSEFKRAKLLGNWWLYVRTHQSKDKRQFAVGGVNPDGTAIWLWPKGRVKTKMHVYDTLEAINKALTAYRGRENVPENERATGNAPTRRQTRQASRGAGGGSDLGGLLSNPLVLAGGGVAAYLAYKAYADGGAAASRGATAPTGGIQR